MKITSLIILVMTVTFNVFANTEKKALYEVNDVEPEICIECTKILKFSKDHLNILNIIKQSQTRLASDVEKFEKMYIVTQEIAAKEKKVCSDRGNLVPDTKDGKSAIIPTNFSLSFDESLRISPEDLQELKLERGEEKVYIIKARLNGQDAFVRIDIDALGKVTVVWYKKNVPNQNQSSNIDNRKITGVTSSLLPEFNQKKELSMLTQKTKIEVGDKNLYGKVEESTSFNPETNKVITSLDSTVGSSGELYNVNIDSHKIIQNKEQSLSASGRLGDDRISITKEIKKEQDMKGNSLLTTHDGLMLNGDLVSAAVTQTRRKTGQGTSNEFVKRLIFGTKECNATFEEKEFSADIYQRKSQSAHGNCINGSTRYSLGFEKAIDNFSKSNSVQASVETSTNGTSVGMGASISSTSNGDKRQDVRATLTTQQGQRLFLNLSRQQDVRGELFSASAGAANSKGSIGVMATKNAEGVDLKANASTSVNGIDVGATISKDSKNNKSIFITVSVSRGYAGGTKHIYQCSEDYHGKDPRNDERCKLIKSQGECLEDERCLKLIEAYGEPEEF